MKAIGTAWGFLAIALLAAVPPATAQTTGVVTCKVTTVTYGGSHAPQHYLAMWIMNSSGGFVRTLQERINSSGSRASSHLPNWWADSAHVHAITGATVDNHTAPVVGVWDCRNAAGAVVADGVYRVRVEFTEDEGSGKVTSTNYIQFTKGASAFSTNLPNLAQFNSISVTYTPLATPHDVAVTRIAAPANGYLNSNVQVTVSVSNLTTTVESFTVSLSNTTTSASIGSRSLTSFPGNGSTNIVFSWGTTGITARPYTLRAYIPALSGETNTADNQASTNVILQAAVHDLAVLALDAPASVPPNTTANVAVVITNKGDFAENFFVVLQDTTASAQIGLRQLIGFPSHGVSNVVFSWNTAGLAWGSHTLEATAGPVIGEVQTEDNLGSTSVLVFPPVQTNRLIPRESVWRYNDAGLNLHGGPWTNASYYDGHWPSGPGPFGYGDTPEATTNSFGPDPNDKYPCTYFRRFFRLDAVAVSAVCRVQRDAGIIVYLNGREVIRDNMPAGAPAYAQLAATAVEGFNETNYFPFAIPPEAFTNGWNLLAAEVHISSNSAEDMSFDLELDAVVPEATAVHDVAVTAVEARDGANPGDLVPVTVRLLNLGNVAETFSVTLTDTNSGATVGNATVTDCGPGEAAQAEFDWATAGAAPGAHTLKATASTVPGETNTANNAASAPVTLASGAGVLQSLNIAGGIGGYCSAVAVEDGGSVIYVGAGATLAVFDGTTSPPTLRGQARLPGAIDSLCAGPGMVYAACGAAGVQIVNAADSLAPRHVGTYDTSGHAASVALRGTRLFVADGPAGLRILDVSTPASPSVLGAYHTEGPATAVAVGTNDLAYVLDGDNGLLILDVSTPAQPVLQGQYDRLGFGRALALGGAGLCAVDGDSGFSIFNVTSPASPARLSRIRLPAAGRAVAATGPFAYVADGPIGLLVLDLSEPATPFLIATNSTPGETADVAIQGSTAYVAKGFDGLAVVDITNPFAPATTATCDIFSRGRNVAVADGYGYVAAGDAGLRVYSVTNPALPRWVGAGTVCSDACDVAVNGATAYVADGRYGLRVLDVSSPSSPASLGVCADAALGAIDAVVERGGQAFVTDGHVLSRVDATNPAAPFLAASTNRPERLFNLAVSSAGVFAAGGEDGLLIFNPTTLGEIGSYNAGLPVTDASADSNRVYIALGGQGWIGLDVSNPAAPVPVASDLVTAARSVAFGGRLLVAADGSQSVRSFDLTTPLTPVARTNVNLLADALRISLDGPFAYISEEETGIAIVDAAPNDHNVDGLPDDWEMLIVNADPDDDIRTLADVNPWDDFDHDGLTNAQEYRAGTSPISADSVLAFSSGRQQAAEGFVIQWKSVPGKTYSIFKSTDLRSGFTLLTSGIAAGPGDLTTYTDTEASLSAFYMVAVE